MKIEHVHLNSVFGTNMFCRDMSGEWPLELEFF